MKRFIIFPFIIQKNGEQCSANNVHRLSIQSISVMITKENNTMTSDFENICNVIFLHGLYHSEHTVVRTNITAQSETS